MATQQQQQQHQQALSTYLCDIEHVRMDPACPRYTHLMYLKQERLAY